MKENISAQDINPLLMEDNDMEPYQPTLSTSADLASLNSDENKHE